jgi:hypothetical protein
MLSSSSFSPPRPRVLVALAVPLAHRFPAPAVVVVILPSPFSALTFSLITGLPLSVPPRRLIVPPSRLLLSRCLVVSSSCCSVVPLSRCFVFWSGALDISTIHPFADSYL